MAIPTPIYDPTDPHDAWALSGVGYAEDKFYFRASDSRGHSHICQVKVSPNLQAQINLLIGDENLPYKTATEVFRDAVVHRVRWILEKQRAAAGAPDAELWKASKDALLRDEIANEREVSETRRALLAEIWSIVQQLTSENMPNKAHEYVDKFEDAVLDWEDIDERRKGVREVEQLRGYLATGRGGNVTPMAAERWVRGS
jgi:hypothetical protein